MLNAWDLVRPSYRDAILASPGIASYWRSGEKVPSITVATLVDGAAAVPDVSPAVNEVQTITLVNALAGNGTWTVTFGANTTSALQPNVTAAQLQTALTGLASIGANNATVTLSGNVYTVTFIGALAGANQAAMTTTSSLTTPGMLDLVGGITGTIAGGVTRNFQGLIANDNDGSIDYNGTTGTVDLGDVYDFAGTVPFTVMCWAQADTFPAAANRILSKWSSAGGGWRIYASSTGGVSFERRDSGAANDSIAAGTKNPMVAGVRYHIACTYDGALMTIYGNGQIGGGTPSQSGQIASTRSLPNTATTLTVASQNSAAASWFDGRIDEIAIWTRALAASEILDLYWIGKG